MGCQAQESVEVRDGENGAIAQAVALELERQRPILARFVRSRIRDRDDADDLLQSICWRALRGADGYRGECPLGQWLLRIAANAVKNHYRARSGSSWEQEKSEFEEILQHAADPVCPYAESDRKLDFQSVLGALDAACSEIERNIVAMVYQGESFDGIASMTRLPAATVRSHFLRGRAKLIAYWASSEPETIGGLSAIRAAIESARAAIGGDRMDTGEYEACRRMDRRSSKFRSACLKFARHLPMPFAFLIVGEARWLF